MTHERPRARMCGARTIAGALGVAMGVTLLVAPGAQAADPERLNEGVGMPVWAGAANPVPELPAEFTVDSQMQANFDADVAAGAGSDPEHDFWIDEMLARYGTAGGHGDTNNWLFTRGRAAYMYTHQPATIGFGGSAAYWHELGVSSTYVITVLVDGQPVTMTEDTAARKQTPSYWRSTFANAERGLRLVQTKFITQENVAVTNVELSSTDGAAKSVDLRAVSPLAGTAEGDELTGVRVTRNTITTLYPRFSGDGFAPDAGALVRTVDVPATGSVAAKVQLGFVTTELPGSRTEYDAMRAMAPADAYTTHVTAYNRWWAQNIPYLNTPEQNIDKTLFYRWWLMRFNFLDADVPGNDFQFPTSMEGVLGYNNAIVLTTGMFIDDLKYLRDPAYSYGPWVSAGETARSGKMEDNPGSPSNWSNSYTEYVTEAGWRSYQLHGGPAAIAENLAVYGENDVEGLLEAYDSNDNNLIEYDWGAMTGNDADAVSFDWARENGHTNMDRAENAYLYSNALASAEAYEAAGDEAKAQEMRALAQSVKTAVMDTLWDAEDDLIKHRQAGGERLLVDWKEINNYYPFSVGLVPKPGDADYEDDYVEALRLWRYYDEYPIFPFYTANQVDAAERGAGGSNNFSVINSTVTFRMLSRVLRDYPNEYVGSDYYKKLLYWNAWAHYIEGDNRLPDQNEFWNTATANTEWGDTQDIGYRSWIHHTILGATNFTMIEDTMGLRPRSDAKIELDPIDIDWPHFMANNIRYRDKDLTVVWDEPGDGERPYGTDVPEGYSAFLDGELAFTTDRLGRVVYDPATGTIEEADDGVEVLSVASRELQAPNEVRFADDARVVDLFAKAGADIATATTGTPNLAEGAAVTATYTSGDAFSSPEAAVNGTTINEPFWGTVGSPNARDSIEIDLGGEQTFDDVRVYFYRTSSSDSPQGGRLAGTRQGYAAPSMYSVEYFDGAAWQPVAAQAKDPVYPRGNLNRVQFPEVTGSRVRVTVTHAPGFRTGVKEVQVRSTGLEAPAVENVAPSVRAIEDGQFNQPGAARLIGTVLDDALPAGELSSRWTVVSAPEGATVLFDDASAATTVVRFSAAGEYRFRLTATDGAQEATADVVVAGEVAAGGTQNVAPAATPTASYTAGWNSVAAVNNGAGQNAGGAQTGLWGTWSGSRPASQWLQYTWDSPVRVSGSEVMFWTDVAAGTGDGVAVPASWVIQYLDGDGEWVDVANPSGYGTARTGTNAVTFDAVTTTALRATFAAAPNAAGTSFSAVGVSEWEVFADAPEQLEAMHVRTGVGEIPELPAQVTAVFSDGTRAQLDVTWPEVTADQVAADGQFTVQGIANGTPLLASVTVWVRSTPPGQINTTEAVTVRTPVGVAPQLPATAVVQYNDGSREMLPVTWAAVDPARYAADGTFTVAGTVDGVGTTSVTATVVVGTGTGSEEPVAVTPGITAAAQTAACVAGEVVLTSGTLTFAPVTGLHYRLGDAEVSGTVEVAPGEHAVTLTVDDGYVLAEGVTSPVTVTVAAATTPDCDEPEEPVVVTPGITVVPQTASCVDGEVVLTSGALTLAPVAGLHYWLGGVEVSGTVPVAPGAHPVALTVDEGYTLPEGVTSPVTVTVAAAQNPDCDDPEEPTGPDFVDVVPGQTFYADIRWMADAGLSLGSPTPAGTRAFHPTQHLTREAMAAFLYRYDGTDWTAPAGRQTFVDVPASHPFHDEIEWMYETGLAEGYDAGDGALAFGGNRTISRQAMAAFMYRYAAPEGYTPTGAPEFADVRPGHAFYTEIEWLGETGLSAGYPDDTFGPTLGISRQATAAFLHRFHTETNPE